MGGLSSRHYSANGTETGNEEHGGSTWEKQKAIVASSDGNLDEKTKEVATLSKKNNTRVARARRTVGQSFLKRNL